MMFGQQPVGLTDQPIAPGPGVQSPEIPQMRQGGMFGGNLGTILAAALSGYTSSSNPAPQQALFAMMAQKRKRALEDQQYQRERQDKRSDFTFEQDYKAAHPGPINNDTVNDYQFIEQTLGADAAKQFLQSKTNPIVMTPYGPMPYSAVNGGGQSAAKPLTDDDILKMQGGQTPPASGGFPGR